MLHIRKAIKNLSDRIIDSGFKNYFSITSVEMKDPLFDTATGPSRDKAAGLLKLPPFAGAADKTYVCDAGCQPNPGWHNPVVWDGAVFHLVPRLLGNNHRAIYQAVQFALSNALQRGCRKVELQVSSELVYMQLITGSYCRNQTLAANRELVINLANKLSAVRATLVKENFQIGTYVITTRRNLRCLNAQFHTNGGNLQLAKQTCRC